MKTSAALSRKDVAVLMGSTVRRYRRGEISERTANRETTMLKALVDGMDKSEPDAMTPDLRDITMEQLENKLVATVFNSPRCMDKLMKKMEERGGWSLKKEAKR